MLLSENKVKKRIAKFNSASPEASGNESDSDEHSDTGGDGNVGWADSIAKVLNTTKPKAKKTLVLSRAKKIKPNEKTKTVKDYGFEIEGEVKEEKPDIEKFPITSEKPKKNVPLNLRAKPSWKDIERERALRKVATRGVVQLFNAVRTQQRDLKEQLDEAGPLDSRRDAVLNNINKKKFLDVLMSGNRAKSLPVDNSVKIEEKDESSDDDDGKPKKSQWSVLEKDFLTKKRTKHWDENSDDSDSSAIHMSDDESDDD